MSSTQNQIQEKSFVFEAVISAISSMFLPLIAPLIFIIILVGVDLIFGMLRAINIDIQNRKKIKQKKVSEEEVQEVLVSSQLFRTVSKLVGFSCLIIIAGSLKFLIKAYYDVPLIEGALVFMTIYELKSIDETWKAIFGWGIYQGIVKLFAKEPLIFNDGKRKVTITAEKNDQNTIDGEQV